MKNDPGHLDRGGRVVFRAGQLLLPAGPEPRALQGSELQLFNARGKIVYATIVSTTADVRVETGRLPAGIYLLCLQKGKLLVSRKVVVH